MSFMRGIEQVQIDNEQLGYALEHDQAFAINFFIPEEITDRTPVPQFHVDILNDMFDMVHQFYCCAVPRDHAKTTLAKIAVCKFFAFTRVRFCVYVSNTVTVASAACTDIANMLRAPNFTAYHMGVCGRPVEFTVEREAEGYYRFILFGGTAREKKCILYPLGAGKQVRGLNIDNQRPDLAVVDDLETSETLETDIGYKKLKKWFYGPFKKALDKIWHKIIQLGNMTAFRCLIRDHTESKFWHSVRYGALLPGGLPLWPEVWPIEKLKKDFEQYKEQGMLDIWFAEMMNMPLADGSGLIRSEEILYLPPALVEDCEWTFITVDPAISTRSWGHRTGIAVHAYVEDRWQVVETFADRGMDPIRLFDKIIELSYRWHCNVVGIESAQYQAALKFVFQHLCLERHIEGMEFVDLYAGQRKNERFAAFATEIKAGLCGIQQDDVLLTQQLLFYDPNRKENDCDLLDAAAYGVQMRARYMGIVMSTWKGHKAVLKAEFVPLVEIASV